MDIPLTISGFSLELPPSIGPSAPAYNADLHNGDITLSLADRPVTSIADLRRILGNVPVGESAEIEILRRGHCVLLDVTPV